MEHLHYRIVDVSTVKELVKRWYPGDFSRQPKKKLAHRALDDILESIDELKYYRQEVFKEPKPKKQEQDSPPLESSEAVFSVLVTNKKE